MNATARALPAPTSRLRDLRWELADRWNEWTPPTWAKPAAFYGALVFFGAFWGMAIAFAGVSALLIAVSLLACFFCLRDFRNGTVLMIMIMPIANSYVFPHAMFGITGLNPLNMLIGATLVVYVMQTMGTKGRPPLFPRPLVWLFLVPMLAGAILGLRHVDEIPYTFRVASQLAFTNEVGYFRDLFLKPLILVLFSVLVGAAAYRSENPEKFITPLVISVWVIALTILGYVAASGVELSDLSGEYSRQFLSPLGMHANDLGRLYAVGYALLLFIWDRSTNTLHKSFLFLSMGVVVAALLLTFSRGAFFGFIIVNLVYLVSRRHAKTMLLAAAAIPVALVMMPGAIWYRLQMGFGHGANAISAGRVDDIWMPLLPEVMASPIWGQGLGSIMWSDAMVSERIHFVAHPHNAYLQALMDMGFVGLALLLGFWIFCWRGFRKLSRDERVNVELRGFFEGAAAGLLAFLIAGMAGSSLLPVPAQAFLWLAVGMMFGIRAKHAMAEKAEKKKAEAAAKAVMKARGRN
jgi:O-antigen ligase